MPFWPQAVATTPMLSPLLRQQINSSQAGGDPPAKVRKQTVMLLVMMALEACGLRSGPNQSHLVVFDGVDHLRPQHGMHKRGASEVISVPSSPPASTPPEQWRCRAADGEDAGYPCSRTGHGGSAETLAGIDVIVCAADQLV